MNDIQTDRRNELIITFCIWKFDDITHEEITNVFGVNPSLIFIKGQQKNDKAAALSKDNAWLFEPHPNKYDTFDLQIISVMNFLNGLSEEAKAICKSHYCEISCAIFIYTDNGESTPWVHLDKEYSKIVNELGIEFGLDLYVL